MSIHGLPDVEHYWREWRTHHSGDLRSSLQQRQRYYNYLGIEALPAQLTTPGALFYNTLPAGAPSSLWVEMAAMAAYRATKEVWYVDPDLLETLRECRWPHDTPASALLYLPRPCIALAIPGDGTYLVYYDLATGEERTGRLEIRFTRLAEGARYRPANHWNGSVLEALYILRLAEGESLDQAFQAVREKARRHMMDSGINETDIINQGFTITKQLSLLVNLVLYAAGSDDIVQHVGHSRLTKRERKARRGTGDSHESYDLREVTISDLGTRFGSAIRRFAQEYEDKNEDEKRTGTTVRPHIRSAHPHLYWTGEGRQIPKVRYLAPIGVGGRSVSDEAPKVTVRKIL